MSYVAVGVVGGGLALNYLGQQQAAGAAGNAAEAQANQAAQMRREVLAQAGQNRERATSLAEASPQELGALGSAYDAASTQLAREQRLMSAIDPALMEASQQALKLLRGETADVNNPMMNVRNQQRSTLLNSLRAQYGPNAEHTSLGQRSLMNFDMETDQMFQQNQMNSLGQVFGIASSDPGARLQRSISGLQQVGQGYGALTDRKLSTELNLGAQTLGALSGTSQQMIQAAGAPYVGAALQGQGLASMGNGLMQGGAMYAGMRGNNAQPSTGVKDPNGNTWKNSTKGNGGTWYSNE